MQQLANPLQPRPVPPADRRSAIEIVALSHAFGAGDTRKQVLFDVDLEVAQGEIVMLMGPSGCGKTTILMLAGALRSVQTGRVRTLGQELNGADQATLNSTRRQIGFVYQAHNLHQSLTALQNVRMGLEVHGPKAMRDVEARCHAMLVAVGLGEKHAAFPAQLSGGQQQRVAISRALVSEPALILADELTSALDKATGRQIVDILRDLARQRGTAVLMVTHDNRILDVADRILEMEDGRIIGERRAAIDDAPSNGRNRRQYGQAGPDRQLAG